MGGIIKATSNAVGNLFGGIGAYEGAKEELKYADNAMSMLWDMHDQQVERGKPFYETGLRGLEGLASMGYQPMNREDLLSNFYNSREYQDLSQQARQQQLAASEATGGLGSTSTGNALASIAPQLGQMYIGQKQAEQSDIMNRLMGMTNIGLSGMSAQNAASSQLASQGANTMMYQGQIAAGKKALPWQIAGQSSRDAGQIVGNVFSPASWFGMGGNSGGGAF